MFKFLFESFKADSSNMFLNQMLESKNEWQLYCRTSCFNICCIHYSLVFDSHYFSFYKANIAVKLTIHVVRLKLLVITSKSQVSFPFLIYIRFYTVLPHPQSHPLSSISSTQVVQPFWVFPHIWQCVCI